MSEKSRLLGKQTHCKYLRVCCADEGLNVFCRPLGKAQNNEGKVRDRVQLGESLVRNRDV